MTPRLNEACSGMWLEDGKISGLQELKLQVWPWCLNKQWACCFSASFCQGFSRSWFFATVHSSNSNCAFNLFSIVHLWVEFHPFIMNTYGRWIDVEVEQCCNYPSSQARHLRLYCMDSSHLGIHRGDFPNAPCIPYPCSRKNSVFLSMVIFGQTTYQEVLVFVKMILLIQRFNHW